MNERLFVARDEEIRRRLLLFLGSLPLPFQCEVGPVRSPRTLAQNSRLWALHSLASEVTGATKNDLHDIMLCEHFGYTELKLGGQIRRVPLKRSSGLDKKEFREFVEFVDNFYAEKLGVWLGQNE